MDQQDVFNRVVAHAREQGRRSLRPTGPCAYRGANGTKCFIGALITDEAYDAGLEYQGASSTEVVQALRDSGIDVQTPEDIELCTRLQAIHDEKVADDVNTPQHWEAGFERLARTFGLEYTPPADLQEQTR